MTRPAALVIGFGLTLLAGKAANIVAGLGLKPAAASVSVLQLLPPQATACDGGFSHLSSSPASATVDAGCSDAPWSNGNAECALGRTACSNTERASRTRPAGGESATEGAGFESSPGLSLIDAIIRVESNGRADAIGDNGRAVGILQIWPITVVDANRILGRDEFTLADRLSPERSVAIFNTITNHYSAGCSDEIKAKRWCNGPRGETKPGSAAYWNRVQEAMK